MNAALAEPDTSVRPVARPAPISRYQRIVNRAKLSATTDLQYAILRGLGRGIRFCTLRTVVCRKELAERSGGYLLACTHVSHLEPILVGITVDRHIDWMARIEFYGRWWSWLFLNVIGAFPVNRQGVPVSSIRTAIARATAGRIVGIFPEGGVVRGPDSVCHGGKIRRGVCLIACRANVPVIPCVTLGAHHLNCVAPWLPFRRARLWMAFGEPIWPDTTLQRRAARQQLAEALESAYQSLYRELTDAHRSGQCVAP